MSISLKKERLIVTKKIVESRLHCFLLSTFHYQLSTIENYQLLRNDVSDSGAEADG
jgi:hypothetical protein